MKKAVPFLMLCAPEPAGSSAMVGCGDIMTGSTLFVIGLAKVSGAYNGTLLDDLETILVSPLGLLYKGLTNSEDTHESKI